MERRQRTREYLKNAKEYINDGEELYQNAYEKVLKRADKTRDAIRKHVEYKKDISRRLGEEILPTIENFQVPDLTTKIDPPFIDGKKAGLTTFSNSFTSAVSWIFSYQRRIIWKQEIKEMRRNNLSSG